MGLSLLFAMMPALAAERPEAGGFLSWSPTTPIHNHKLEQNCWGADPCRFVETSGHGVAFGLSLRVPMRGRFSVKSSPNWHRVNFGANFEDRTGTSTASTTANRWEVPAVLQWRVAQHIAPGIGAAISYVTHSRSQGEVVQSSSYFGPSAYKYVYDFNNLARKSATGAIAEVEFPFRRGFCTIAPDVRYTRWIQKHFGYRGRLNTATIGLSVRF